MKPHAHRDSALLQRIERLERQNRWMRLTLPAAAVALLALFLLGQAPAPRKVEAGAFVLKDGRGVVRGTWRVAPDGAVRFSMRSAAGKPRLKLELVRDYPRVEIFDDKDRSRAVLASFPSGHLGLSLYGKNRKPRASLYLDDKDTPRLGMLDSRNVTRLGLGVLADDNPHLSLHDQRKQTVASLYTDTRGAPRLELYRKMKATVRLAVAPGGSRGLVLFGDRGKPLAGLGIDSANAPNLKLFDRAGKVLFKAP